LLYNIQLLRFIASFMIVMTHIILFGNKKYELGLPVLFTVEEVFKMGVDIFFVISGFIMVHTTYNKKVNVKDFLYKRCIRIYPVYWLICLSLLPVLTFKPEWINAGSAVPPSFWHSWFLVPSEGAPLLMVAWTLEFEMFFYLIFALFLPLGTKKQIVLITSIFTITSIIGQFIKYEDITNPILTLITSNLLLEFVAGMWLGFLYPKLRASKTTAYFLMGVAIILTLTMPFIDIDIRTITLGIPAVFITASFLYFEKINKKPLPQFSLWGGDISYALYLIHIPIITVVARSWQFSGLDKVIPSAVMLCIAIITSLISSTILFYVIEKPLTKALRNIQTSRQKRSLSNV